MVQVLIRVVDTSTITCGSKSSIQLLEFLWDSTLVFTLLMYGIVCVPFDSPKVLYLRHHEATCRGWTQSKLCRPCLGNYRPVIDKFLPICTASSSCKCHICLRQPHHCEVLLLTRCSTSLVIWQISPSIPKQRICTICRLSNLTSYPQIS